MAEGKTSLAVLNKLELLHSWAPVNRRANQFLGVYPYIAMLRGSYLDAAYRPSSDFAAAFPLTSSGQEMLANVRSSLPDIDDASCRMGVAAYFSHDELYVDVETADLAQLHAGLASEMAAGKIRFYQEYGRILYDRFFEAFPSRTERLSFDQVQILLAGLPTAPYHVGHLTVGPFGPAKAANFRMFAPTHTAPLWHCSDPGCVALHTVRLDTAPSDVNRVYREITRQCDDRRIPRSEWDQLFPVLADRGNDYYSDASMPGLPWMLADGFSEEELKTIVSTVLDLDPSRARKLLSPVLEVRRPSASIAADLSEHEALQSVLMFDERLVGQAIEAAVLQGRINVPVTEQRRAVVFKKGGTWWKLTPEVGALGLRNVSTLPDFPLVRLRKLITHVGSTGGLAGALEWELRFASGSTLSDKLARTVQETPPVQLLRRFCLASAESLNVSIEYLQPMFFEMPRNEVEENYLLDRILWKLGFSVEQHPDELSTFWRRADAMMSALPDGVGRLSSDVEDLVRSAAVNYFVSLEDLFDRTIAFTGWGLLHDHYAGIESKQFAFDLDDARAYTASRLNEAGAEEKLNPSGQNTLWPLMYNLGFLGVYIRELYDEAGESDRREEGDIPGFHKQGAAPFPFLHRLPLHDLEPGSVAEIADILSEVSTSLTRLDLANLRNRLEHKRPDADFPSAEEIRHGLDVVAKFVKTLEESGLLPVLYVFESLSRDEYGRTRTVLRDYAGRVLQSAGPTGSRYGRMPSLERPQLPLKVARLREIPDFVRFTLSEASPYREKWANYPRRRVRMATTGTLPQDDTDLEVPAAPAGGGVSDSGSDVT